MVSPALLPRRSATALVGQGRASRAQRSGQLLYGVGTSFVSESDRPIDPIGVLWCLVAVVTCAVGVQAQKP